MLLSAVVIFFFVIILMSCLHLYARWYLLPRRRRRRHLRRNRFNRRTNLFIYMESENLISTSAATVARHGLDTSVLNSLPVFLYSPKTHPESVECAVCLSEFEEGELGRVLPKCNHSFHIDCIDMWFQSHSNCPLCRALVEAVDEARPEVVITVCEPERPEPSSSSGLCSECQHDEKQGNRTSLDHSSSSSSIGFIKKPSSLLGMTIEVPRRDESFRRDDSESSRDSPSNQSPFRSPISRMLSFTRILNRERKASPSDGGTVDCSSRNELESEPGGREETQ